MTKDQDQGSEATMLTDNERTLALAAVMIRLLGEKHNLSDADMTEVCAHALVINMRAEGGDQEARALAIDARDRLLAVWQGVHAARAVKTIN